MTRMPAFFIGHGSPMNALMDNGYAKDLRLQAESIPKPEAILVISAHWIHPGFMVSASAAPPQIYDFYGFPDELYQIKYPASGSPDLAARTAELLGAAGFPCGQDASRGIDHAAWAVLTHMYPDAGIPVVELGLDYKLKPERWFEVGKALSPLRDEGILIIGSGNIVHNLYKMVYDMDTPPLEWNTGFNALVKGAIARRDWSILASYSIPIDASRLAVPTPEHFIPLLPVLGAMDEGEKAEVFHESFQNATISMTSYRIG